MSRRSEHDVRLEQKIDALAQGLDRLEAAAIVSEPATAVAAEAYEGLRRQVMAAAGARAAHLNQLAQLAEAVRTGEAESLPFLVDDWMEQAGLARVDDPDDDRYVDVLGRGPGDGEPGGRRLLRPGYIDATTGRPVMMGQAETANLTAAQGSTS